MTKFTYIIAILILTMTSSTMVAQESRSEYGFKQRVEFKTQLSAWGHYNEENDHPLFVGGRAIPQLNYKINFGKSSLIDFETSANIYGNSSFNRSESFITKHKLDPYRIWARYSTNQVELRIGLQKINFGSATMLRALRWFDHVDQRDPLRLTNGVWGALGRYYFLNNANIWLWGLYGNDGTKGIEFNETFDNSIEFGGRFQSPINNGEFGISLHHREIDNKINQKKETQRKANENRIGLDMKLDLTVGLWFEAVWVNNNHEVENMNNQEVVTVGTDYTFGIGNGLNMMMEHMMIATDKNAFEFSKTVNLSALSVGYPLGMFDTLSAILYYDWVTDSTYNFINWQRQFDRSSIYFMGYWNPKNNKMQSMGGGEALTGGIGGQIMYVYNF